MPGYHLREIPRGTFGEYSKVEEEFEEFLDALEQRSVVMALQELSDFLLAGDENLKRNYESNGIGNMTKFIAMGWRSPGERDKKFFDNISNSHPNKRLAEYFRNIWNTDSLYDLLTILDDWCRLYNLTLEDIWVMSNITRRVFEEGYRTAK